MKSFSTIDLTFENQYIKNEYFKELSELYDTNMLQAGDSYIICEDAIASYLGTKYCSLVGAGTMALHIAGRAFDFKEGDEVIVPANTFFATAVGMYHAGAKIILADVDPDTMNLTVDNVRKVITPNTKAICLVHLYGAICNPAEFKEFNVPIIEDASHAFGGSLNGRKVGNLGEIGCLSAGPIKAFGGIGSGGFISYNQDKLREYIEAFINNGQTSRHYGKYIGHNFRMDSINALFYTVKLRHYDAFLERRRKVRDIYNTIFDENGIAHQSCIENSDPALWVYVIKVDKKIRNALVEKLRDKNITTLVQYTYTINQLPIWNAMKARDADVPVSEELIQEIISLPINAGLSEDDARYIADAVVSSVEELL